MKETEISRLYDRKIVYEASREKKKKFLFCHEFGSSHQAFLCR